MKVKKLIKLLEKLDPDSLVVMSSDSEGNGFSPLSDLTEELYLPENKWRGEIVHSDTEDGVYQDAQPSVVIWPTN